jgi:hypothetical protein
VTPYDLRLAVTLVGMLVFALAIAAFAAAQLAPLVRP